MVANIMSIFTKTVNTDLTKQIEDWNDEQTLFNFSKFLEKVGISSQFIQDDEGLITHQVMTIQCGDKIIVSEPQELEWPLQPLPMPEAFVGKLN